MDLNDKQTWNAIQRGFIKDPQHELDERVLLKVFGVIILFALSVIAFWKMGSRI